MPQSKLDAAEHKNRFMRFTPIISMGNIVTAIAVLIGAVTAWVQLNNQVGNLALITKTTAETLATENNARKDEIKAALAKQDIDREDLYKKIASDHAETMADIRVSQQANHDDIKEIAQSIGVRFDRIEDKLDKKVDKRP